jgi:hypothetical protein
VRVAARTRRAPVRSPGQFRDHQYLKAVLSPEKSPQVLMITKFSD